VKSLVVEAFIKTAFLCLAFNLLLGVSWFVHVGSLNGLMPLEPIVATFAMIAAVPTGKEIRRQYGRAYFGFLLLWLGLSMAILIAGFSLMRR